jgi:hypothetical protein
VVVSVDMDVLVACEDGWVSGFGGAGDGSYALLYSGTCLCKWPVVVVVVCVGSLMVRKSEDDMIQQQKYREPGKSKSKQVSE